MPEPQRKHASAAPPGRRATRALPAAVAALSLALAAEPPAVAGEREIEALAGRLAEELPGKQLAAVAVVDFADLRGEPTELGRYLAEELSVALARAVGPAADPPGLRVIDRVHLARILDELELSATGLLDPVEIRRIGEIAGVDGLITGSLVAFSDDIRVTLKVLDVRTGEILFGAGAELPRTPTLTELEERPLTVLVPCAARDAMTLELDGPPHQTVHFQAMEIALRGCTPLEGALRCLFTVTRRDGDGNLYVFGSSRAILPSGTAVPVSRVHLGEETASGSLSRVGTRLVEGIPIAGSVTFEGIPPGTRFLQQLELGLHGKDARFTQVPIRKP